jgi:hypothetical protein
VIDVVRLDGVARVRSPRRLRFVSTDTIYMRGFFIERPTTSFHHINHQLDELAMLDSKRNPPVKIRYYQDVFVAHFSAQDDAHRKSRHMQARCTYSPRFLPTPFSEAHVSHSSAFHFSSFV